MKKREAASHLLVFMISDELRNKKPYAIPVRILTYKSITDAQMRELRDELKMSMDKIGMTVVGMLLVCLYIFHIFINVTAFLSM